MTKYITNIFAIEIVLYCVIIVTLFNRVNEMKSTREWSNSFSKITNLFAIIYGPFDNVESKL